MTYEVGRITNVYLAPTGSELASDAAASATSITLVDAYDFNEEGGGTLEIAGDEYTYTAVDQDTDTVTLATGLLAAFTQGEEVLAVPYGETKWAACELDDDDEGIEAMVSFALVDRLDDGIRDPQDQENCLLSDDTGRWMVVNLDEEIPGIIEEYFDPVVNPDVPPPSAPPGTSPEIEVVGTVSSIVVRAIGETALSTSLQYHISTTENFTESEDTLFTTTKSTVVVITSLADGSPLVADTPYYIRVIAENATGVSADQSDEKTTLLNLDVVDTFVTATLVAGWILTGKITVGTGEPPLTIDANTGITIPQPGGEINFPVDGTVAKFTGILTAIQQLTVSGLSTFNNLVQLGALMTIGSGISDPDDPLAATSHWDSTPQKLGSPAVPTPENFWFGLCDDPTNTYWVYVSEFFGCDVRKIDKSTGNFFSQASLSVAANTGGFYGQGITRIGSNYYVLARRHTNGSFFVVKYDSSFNELGRTPDFASSAYWTKKPGIGRNNAGDFVYVIGINGGQYKWWGIDVNELPTSRTITNITHSYSGGQGTYTFSLSAAATDLTIGARVVVTGHASANGTYIVKSVSGSTFTTDGPDVDHFPDPGAGGTAEWKVLGELELTAFASGLSQRDAAGFFYGAAGTAADRLWVNLRNTGALGGGNPCYLASTKARQISDEFLRAGNHDPRGLWWDGTRFWGLDSNAIIWQYGVNVTSPTIEGAWTAADENATGGLHETGPSPTTQYVWPLRSKIKLETPPAPEEHLSTQDAANRVKVYVSSTVGGTLRLQGGGALAVGERTLIIETINGASAAAPANNFGGIGGLGIIRTVGENADSNPTFEVFGSGQGRAGPLEWDDAGVGQAPMLIQCGTVSSGAFSAANTDKTVNITFPHAFPAGTVPMMAYGIGAASSQNVRYVPTTISASNTGASVSLSRATGTAAVDVNWFAMVPTT